MRSLDDFAWEVLHFLRMGDGGEEVVIVRGREEEMRLVCKINLKSITLLLLLCVSPVIKLNQ